MTIYEIKARTYKTSPYFFSRETLRCFGQTLESFRVYKQKDGKFLIIAPSQHGIGITQRLFNPVTNELERIPLEA